MCPHLCVIAWQLPAPKLTADVNCKQNRNIITAVAGRRNQLVQEPEVIDFCYRIIVRTTEGLKLVAGFHSKQTPRFCCNSFRVRYRLDVGALLFCTKHSDVRCNIDF